MKASDSTGNVISALLEAQEKFGVPVRDMENVYLGNKYSSLNAVLDAVRDALNKNGLVIQQGSDVRDVFLDTRDGEADKSPGIYRKQVCVWSRLWHVSGEWLQSEVVLEPQTDKSGRITPQAMGSALSYGRRYSLKALLALGDSDMEDDGALASDATKAQDDEPITPEQAEKLDKLLERSGADVAKFAAFLGVEQVSDLKQRDFKRAESALKQKLKQEKANG